MIKTLIIRRLDFSFEESFFDGLPVGDFPDVFEVVGPDIEVLEVIGMFPHIDAK